MSGSYDRPPGRAPRQGQIRASSFEGYDEVVTGPPGAFAPQAEEALARQPYEAPVPTTSALGPLEPQVRREPSTQSRAARRDYAHTPIVEAGSVTGRSLTLVISIMCCLACLTAGAVYMIYQSAQAWLNDIASEVTIHVESKAGADTEAILAAVAAFLERQPGVQRVKPLGLRESQELLEPWLGKSEVIATLPVPRLVALELDRTAPPDLDALRQALAREFKDGVTLDDHRRWQQQIRGVMHSFAIGGFSILLLVGAATTAVIVSATRAAMASNREIVEVLHFVGATDGFIAREFEKHFLRLGVRAGLIGAVLAVTVFLLMPYAMDLVGGGAASSAEMRRIVGSGNLDASGYVLLGIVVVVISALCMLTSRYGVFRILNTRQ